MGELQKVNGAASNVPMIPSDIEAVLVQGDIGKMAAGQRVEYYNALCSSLGLNPLTQPFEYLTLNGKVKLYAKKDCTDQLRRIYNVSVALSNRAIMEGLCIQSATATMPGGRTDESTGAVSIAGLKGEALANAIMKAETKAKRRVTLSICGLGMLDESEVDSIPGAIRESEGSREQQKAVADSKLAAMKAGMEPEKPWKTKKQFLEIFEQLRLTVGDETYLKALDQCAGVTEAKDITDSAAALSAYQWLTGEAERMQNAEPMFGDHPQKPWKTFKAFLLLMEAAKKDVGIDAYYGVLGRNGFEHANEIKDGDKALAVYNELKAIAELGEQV